MPTFTTIALETLLEPRSRDSFKNSSNLKQQPSKSSVQNPQNARNGEDEKGTKKKPKPPPNHIYISPALYTTPEPTPILDSSSAGSFPPSPYVFNRKGRGGKAIYRRIDGIEIQQEKGSQGDDERDWNENGVEFQVGEEIVVDEIFLGGGTVGDGDENCVMDDDFLEPRCDSFSVASSSDLNDSGRQAENLSLVSNQGEFFDAIEDFSSDGSISNAPSCGRQSLESELRATRLSLLEEIERRKTTEDALGTMYSQWQRVRDLLLSQAGLTFPTPPNPSTMQIEINSLEQFSQEVIVARFVAEAIGKGEARAEAELAAEVIIESKDQEMSRLRDRLQYYEAMNREMSQRNLEVMEVARRQRVRRRGQRKWLWGCIGITIAIGASVIAYSYLPETIEHPSSPTASDPPDASCK